MKEKLLPFRQIEWWLMTILIFLIILTNTLGAKIDLDRLTNSGGNLTAAYFAYIFIPLTLYGAFYFLHMRILPTYQKDRQKAKMILYSLLTFLGSWFVVGVFYVNANFGDVPFMPFFFIAIVIYFGYLLAVRILDQLFFLTKSTSAVAYNVIRCILLYNFMMIFLSIINRYYHQAILIVYTVAIPLIVLLLLYNYFLIFRMKINGKTKVAKAYTLFLPITVFILFTVASIAKGGEEVFIIGAVVSLFILAVFNPLAQSLLYKYHKMLGRIGSLTNQLDQKSADLQFLRSQINPHFLFNALNSLYGTALQESSEKTAEGIQKLGDMMRFMLHENNQDSIAVEREKEYLVNYVDLQLLRTSGQENIEIIFNRTEGNCTGEIAPMMLIPFVENAFKHGISLQKRSWVKISLRCVEGEVHLDINNSIHRSTGEDPERQSSGIGLSNVKQRLNLLYPNRHELVIRENELEYFVHLSIQLR
jgi:two-component system LytT family sensor kinase